jgi:hypothetical protein
MIIALPVFLIRELNPAGTELHKNSGDRHALFS